MLKTELEPNGKMKAPRALIEAFSVLKDFTHFDAYTWLEREVNDLKESLP